MDAQMMEMTGLGTFGTLSIAFALRAIGSILAIWLALRIANNIRTSEENNLVAKILGTGFGVLVVYGSYYWSAAYANVRANTASNFNEMSANGVELTAGTQEFATRFASGDPIQSALVILFHLIVVAIILSQIWMPKK